MISMELISTAVLFVCFSVFSFLYILTLADEQLKLKKVLKTTHNIDANRKSKCKQVQVIPH